jgi:F-type H+-transporting ATPase subunit epsilon
MAFQVVLVTPEQQVLEESASQVILPAHDGELGILTGRAPLLVKLGIGILRLDLAGGQKRYFFIDGGIAQVKDDRLTVVTTEARTASEVDVEEARAELAEATAKRITDEQSFDDRQRAMQRARAQQELVGRR